jgi:hypothetical protein
MTPPPTIHSLAADVADRIPGMQADCKLNNAQVITQLLQPVYEHIRQQQELGALTNKGLRHALVAYHKMVKQRDVVLASVPCTCNPAPKEGHYVYCKREQALESAAEAALKVTEPARPDNPNWVRRAFVEGFVAKHGHLPMQFMCLKCNSKNFALFFDTTNNVLTPSCARCETPIPCGSVQMELR